ncbi:MAG: L,D-transpeptidase family protein [Desulfuromonadaceae bacterium]|nr:L,D-transpeptidase family protein [Desulfuromonadaceae bacterium]
MLRTKLLSAMISICLMLAAVLNQPSAYGAEYAFIKGVGGAIGVHTINGDDSLVELARSFDIGFNEISAANPGVDPYIPSAGTRIMIPNKWILPDVPNRSGIVINLAEMRLYYFYPRTKGLVDTYPVGIGDEGWDTPIGTYRIIEKIVHPAWHVPKSIRAQKPELPDIVPAGPDNPLGTHAMRLSVGTVLIHGTDRPFGIGRRVSHGCIHLYPEDIVRLFRKVKMGTQVVVIRQPVKFATVQDRVWVEIHGDEGENLEQEAESLMVNKKLFARVDPGKLKTALRDRYGVPTDVTKD